MLNRRAVTLMELLVALTVLGIVSSIVGGIVVRALRASTKQARLIDQQQQRRVLATVLPAELRALDAADGDIAAMSAGEIDMRAMRWLGFTCAPPRFDARLPERVEITLTRRRFFGLRDIDPGTDSILLYRGPGSSQAGADPWVRAKSIAVVPTPCSDGGPGVRVTIAATSADGPILAAVTGAAPVRGFERVRYRLYRPATDSGSYVGLQTPGGTLQPLAGPLPPAGFALGFADAAGNPTLDTRRVARIDVVVRTETESLATSVALRNNRRP